MEYNYFEAAKEMDSRGRLLLGLSKRRGIDNRCREFLRIDAYTALHRASDMYKNCGRFARAKRIYRDTVRNYKDSRGYQLIVRSQRMAIDGYLEQRAQRTYQ